MQTWTIFALGSAIFAALTAIFGKLGVQDLNSNLATLIRTIVIFVLLASVVTVRKEWALPQQSSARSWLFLVVSGICTGISWLCYYRALQLGPASRVAPLEKVSVAFTVVLAVLFLGEALSWKTIVGVSLILTGSILLAL